MAYTKTIWTNNTTPAIHENNLNKMEQGIKDAHDATNIKTWYESNADTFVYTGAERVLVSTISNLATDIATNIDSISTLDDRVLLLEASHTLLIIATSTAVAQEPIATDTPLQIEFGGIQTTTNINIASDGAITFNVAGKYIVSPFFQYGRAGSVGTSILLNRYLVNGTQVGNSLVAKIDSADILVPWSSSIQFTAEVGDTLTIEVMRDSTGNDSGGLFAVDPTLIGWNNAPCASIQIYKAT